MDSPATIRFSFLVLTLYEILSFAVPRMRTISLYFFNVRLSITVFVSCKGREVLFEFRNCVQSLSDGSALLLSCHVFHHAITSSAVVIKFLVSRCHESRFTAIPLLYLRLFFLLRWNVIVMRLNYVHDTRSERCKCRTYITASYDTGTILFAIKGCKNFFIHFGGVFASK